MKQHHSARDADGLLFEAEEPQKIVADEQERYEHEIRKRDFAQEDDAPPFRRDGLQHRETQRDVPERIHDQEKRHKRGKQVHVLNLSMHQTNGARPIAFTRCVDPLGLVGPLRALLASPGCVQC
jgi:hypothetical protein